MGKSDLFRKAERFTSENSTAILTGVGVTGVVTTAFLTGKASFKAGQLINQEELRRREFAHSSESQMSRRDEIKLVWPQYIPAVGVGVLTISSIVMANRISSKQAAALATAYGLSEKALQEYKDKVIEKIGETKEVALREEIAQDRVTKKPVESQEVIIVGNGNVLCYDSYSGRYFESSIEAIKKAVNSINYEIINHSYASLSSFYDEIGIPPNQMSNDVGWNLDNILEVSYSTTMSTDDRPCMVIDFQTAPIPNYTRLY